MCRVLPGAGSPPWLPARAFGVGRWPTVGTRVAFAACAGRGGIIAQIFTWLEVLVFIFLVSG